MKRRRPKLWKRSLPRVQKSIVESLDSGRAADIVEEMDPDAAADLLADLPEDRTEQILVQMEPEAQQDVVELLEHREETAAGRMTTEFLALPVSATVQNAIDSLREFEGGVEAVSTIYLVDSHGTLTGAVPLARLVLAQASTPMLSLTQEPLGPRTSRASRKMRWRNCSISTIFRLFPSWMSITS